MVAVAKRTQSDLAADRIVELLDEALSNPKASRTAKDARRKVVEELWVSSATTANIIVEVTKAFRVDPRTVEMDIRAIKEKYRLSEVIDRQDRALQMRADFRDIKLQARRQGDMRTAALVNDRLCKMDGLYAPERTENININVTINVTIDTVLEALDTKEELDHLRAILDKLEARDARLIGGSGKVIDVPVREVLTTATPNVTPDDGGKSVAE